MMVHGQTATVPTFTDEHPTARHVETVMHMNVLPTEGTELPPQCCEGVLMPLRAAVAHGSTGNHRHTPQPGF